MTAQRRGVFQVTLLRRLDLQQPDERRLVLVLERDYFATRNLWPAPTCTSSPGWIICA
jgi:hypothetical protein